MFIFEFKLYGKKTQYQAIDEAIRTVQFVRNKCLRYWQDNRGIGQKAIYAYSTVLRKEFSFVEKLNSTACQASAERAWSAISRFYDNCRKQIKGKKGYPKYQKRCRSVEYKTSGWKLSDDKKKITFTDKNGIGSLKMKGTRDLNYFSLNQIKRVRIIKSADGYYVQFCIQEDIRCVKSNKLEPTKHCVGIDVGLKHFYVDSDNNQVEIPQYYRKAEKRLNLLNRRKSKKFRKNSIQSNNYQKARNRYARKHLRVSRQREEFAKRVALSVVQSNDLIAYEDLRVKNMVRNRHLAKSINDVAWSLFRRWLEYFGRKYGKVTIAVPPHNTSQNCSSCGKKVQKSLSTRTHICSCGYVDCRDRNAAINILKLGLSTAGHVGTREQSLNAWGESTSTLVEAILPEQVGSVNQESHGLA
jgi:putative transposase